MDQLSVSSGPHRPRVMLVDGFGLIFRAYFALEQTELSTSAGERTAAVFGFASMLLDVLRNQRPHHAVVALEGGRTFRDDLFDDYKANRAAMPEDLIPQVARITELIDALNIPTTSVQGYEADDVIGSLSTRLNQQGECDVLIVTGDSDLLQLVDEHVTVVLPGARRFGELRTFDRAAVIDRYGFGPEFVPDYKALVGDTSDNIPGVPGIGEKTAKALIAEFGPVEAILKRVDQVTPTRARNALLANGELAHLSKSLATIVRDLDLDVDLEHSAVGNYDRDRVFALFRELEFRSLLEKLPTVDARPVQRPVEIERPPSVRRQVVDEDGLDDLVEAINASGTVAVDVETTSTDPIRADLVGIAIATSPSRSFYVPVGHCADDESPQLDLGTVKAALDPVLTDSSIAVVAHHGKYDLQVLQRHGFSTRRLTFDTMIAAYLLGESSLRLKDLAFTRLGIAMTEISELIGTGRAQLTMDQVPVDAAAEYACGDVEATYELVEPLRQGLVERDQLDLLERVELPLVPVLIEMERAGVAIDVAYLGQLSGEITSRLAELEQDIEIAAGRPIKISSNKQLADLLFMDLGLPTGRKTKTGYSVDADVLERLRDAHPIVALVLEHRSLSKLKSTYVDALPAQVNPTTNRVHTSYNQTVAATGRLSSTNPNLQNIPIRTELGRRVRKAFVADQRPESSPIPDAIILSADYSQIELRLLAHMSQEPFLIDAFQRGEDIHRATAGIVYGVSTEDVTSDMRRVAKTVNFGIIYGMQAYGLARDSGLSQKEAQVFIDAYWARLPKVKNLFEELLRAGAERGFVSAPSGRRRYLPDLTSSNGMRRLQAERMAVNMPIQGAAADIIKLAMIQLDHELKRATLAARMLLQVHDELVLEVSEAALSDIARLVVTTMEQADKLLVPLVVDVSVGPNWDNLEDIAVT